MTLFSEGRYRRAEVTGDPRRVPAELSLIANYEETAQWLKELRRDLHENWARSHGHQSRAARRAPVKLSTYHDFTSIERISPTVALLIASEYDRVVRSGSWVPRAVDIDRWQPNVRGMLAAIGFLEMVGVVRQGPTILEAEGRRLLRLRSGDLTYSEEVGNFLKELGQQAIIPELYGAIIEALVNTRHHAYPKDHSFAEPHFPGWWLTGLIDVPKRNLWVTAYDHGLSIPGTLLSWSRYPSYERLWRRIFRSTPDPMDTSRDGAAIRLALQVGRSSTGEAFRGRGLPAMDEVIDLCVGGRLTIFSRCGTYSRAKRQRPRHTNRTHPIGGTLVEWQLRF